MKKKSIVAILLVILIVAVVTIILIFAKEEIVEETQEKENESKFSVYKIHYYSNVGTINNQTTYQNPEWNLNVYLYCDIAIYLGRTEEYNESNYIKSLYIDNIEFSKTSVGTSKLYYLNPLNFGNSEITENMDDDEIVDNLNYNIINDENENDDMKYTIPVFFEDCSNPITLRFVNENILENYKISNSETVSFDGSLLKNANIALEDLESTVYLNLNIVTQDNQIYTINLELDIPIENEENDIYEGSIEIIEGEENA